MDSVDINSINRNGSDWIHDTSLNGTMTAMKLDTDEQANILNDLEYQKIQDKPALEPTVVKLKGVGGHQITVH